MAHKAILNPKPKKDGALHKASEKETAQAAVILGLGFKARCVQPAAANAAKHENGLLDYCWMQALPKSGIVVLSRYG